jgi:kynureninase
MNFDLETTFEPGEAFARHLDATDPLRAYRDQFLIPARPDGRPWVYFCGHSLGLQPRTARAVIEQELDDWARLGVEAHFRGQTPWYGYHQTLRDAGGRLVGGLPDEVVFMNGLTVNLHLMLLTFYRPTAGRYRILIDEPTFPSDLYAVQSQLRHHGYDPAQGLLTVRPRDGEHTVREEDVEEFLERRGSEIAVVLLSGINFLTGQFMDMERLTAAAHRWGCVVGFDLAHGAGNVPLRLHDWQADFAVWCGYKYLNGGPGAVGGCFVHERHGRDTALPRLAGWWGNDPATRFRMQLLPGFVPVAGADGWQVSNPPVLALAPLRASLALFDEAGLPALRAKSERLNSYLLYLLDRLPTGRFEVVTPRDAGRRGCQMSIVVRDRARELHRALEEDGVSCDFREPNVIRVAPVPLYNGYHDIWTFAQALGRFH